MRLLHALLLFPFFTAPALAQTAPATAPEHHGRATAEEHFAEANTTHDGKLTLEQAKAGYKSVARAFDRIDMNHRGYVTMDDIKAWKAAKKAARQSTKQAIQADDSRLIVRPGSAFRRAGGARLIDTGTHQFVPPPQVGVDLPNAPLDTRAPS